MESFSTSVVLLILLATLIYWYFKRSFSYWKSRGVAYIEPNIPYGNIKGVGQTAHLAQLCQNIYRKFKGHELCGIYFFTQPIVLLLDLELVKNILVKEFSSFTDRNLYYNDKDDPLSAHLVALDGKEWKDTRMKMTPTFTTGKMKFMFPTIDKVGDYVNEMIAKKDELEMKDVMSRFTMNVIGTCAFGIDCDTFKEESSEFVRMGRMAMEKPRLSTRAAFLANHMKTLARILHVKAIRDDVSSFFMNVVSDTIEYREKNAVDRNDFMDLLIKLKTDESGDASKGLTINQIAAQSFLFFAAGYETASTTMLFTLYELALNPEIQTRVRQEIRATLKKHGEFTYEAMMDMAYLDQIINETLRKYPPFTMLRRVANKNYKVPGTSIVIEKGTTVLVPIYSIHHDAEYYADPEKYDPGRFTPEEMKKRNPMAWLAFGEGPRNCIALRFGMMETRIGLTRLLNNYEFLPCSKTANPIEFDVSSVVLSAKGGIYLKVKSIPTGN